MYTPHIKFLKNVYDPILAIKKEIQTLKCAFVILSLFNLFQPYFPSLINLAKLILIRIFSLAHSSTWNRMLSSPKTVS